MGIRPRGAGNVFSYSVLAIGRTQQYDTGAALNAGFEGIPFKGLEQALITTAPHGLGKDLLIFCIGR